MPGPIIRDTTPEWLKPQNASVLDSPVTKAIRALASLTGMNDPAQGIYGAVSPMPLIGLVPREPVSQIVGRLAKDTLIDGGAMPDSIKRAITYLAERYPRIMSHIDSVDTRANLEGLSARPSGSVLGAYESFDASRRGAAGAKPASRIGSIKVNPSAISGNADPNNVVAHEVGHAAQDISQTDRAWRKGERTFRQEYARADEMAGYKRNPYEQQARRIGDRQAGNAFVMREIRKDLERGLTADQIVEQMMALDRSRLDIGGVTSRRDLRRLVNVAQTMMQRAKE